MIKIIKAHADYLLTVLDVNEANLGNADKFREEMVALLNTHQKKVVLDLGEVEYMDSSFLGSLVSALKYAISINSDIILINLKKDIHDLFTLIRLDKVFKIHKDFNEVL